MQHDLDREFERERWRGAVERRTMAHEEELRKLWDWKEEAAGDLRELKTKLAVYVVMASTAGGVITSIIVAAIQHALK